MTDIQIITLPTANLTDALDHGLVALTEAICQVTGEQGAYGLGGPHGYGEDYENDVFVMRRYYWGDCDCGADDREEDWSSKNFHAPSCYYVELQAEQKKAGISYIDTDKNEYVSVTSSMGYKRESRKLDDIHKRLCAKYGLSYPHGCAVHCTCGHQEKFEAADVGHRPTCAVELPNFRHKPTGLEVRWYKWIGRSTEVKNANGVDLQAMFSECLSSLSSAKGPDAS